MEKFFHLKENGTAVSTEITAGLTTFFAMSYIIVVNPQILSQTGMPWGGVFLATGSPGGPTPPEHRSAWHGPDQQAWASVPSTAPRSAGPAVSGSAGSSLQKPGWPTG